MMPEMNAAPRTSLNQRLGEERRLGVVHLDVETDRAVAHARGGKINDVVLDVVAGGLRELLLARGELTEGLELIAAVPGDYGAPAPHGSWATRSGCFRCTFRFRKPIPRGASNS